jgi:hypothetical protein
MKLIALVNLRVPEGAFAAGQPFDTTADIAQRVIEAGYARDAAADAPVATREPEVAHRDPGFSASVKRRKK